MQRASSVKTCATHGTILQPRQRCPACNHHFDGSGQQSRHTAAWRRYRRLILSQRPLCEACKAAGQVVQATEVHHLTERSQGGALFPGAAGIQALCKPCHSRIGMVRINQDRGSTLHTTPLGTHLPTHPPSTTTHASLPSISPPPSLPPLGIGGETNRTVHSTVQTNRGMGGGGLARTDNLSHTPDPSNPKKSITETKWPFVA